MFQDEEKRLSPEERKVKCRYDMLNRKNSLRRGFTLVIMNTIKEKYKTTLNHRLECIH